VAGLEIVNERMNETARFWDTMAARRLPRYWTDYPLVRRYVNTCVTDAWWAYPTHGFKAAWAYRPLPKGLSIGCGSGDLEKDLRWLRICEEVDAFDISPESIRLAREKASVLGVDQVNFEVRDCETASFGPEEYDAVFFHGSLHHISDPDALLDRILPSLRSGALIYVDEYVGPSRDEWNQGHLANAQVAYQSLPDEWKITPELGIPFDSTDPSEMIRASRIIPAVEERFDIIWHRPYWGNVLYPVLSHVDDERASLPESEPILARLIETEKSLVQSGDITSPLFAWIVGRHRF